MIPTAQYNISTIFRRRAINLDYLHAVLEQKVKESPVLQAGQLTLMDDRLVISLPGELLFGRNDAELTERARQSLFDLGGVLRHVENQLAVDAYVPPSPNFGRYESAWEMSLARAISVANALTSVGYPDEIIIYGFGDSRTDLIARIAPEQSPRLSRRVDIVINSTSAAE
jgi:chemotaxis protein MotB